MEMNRSGRIYIWTLLMGCAANMFADWTVHVPGCGYWNGPTCGAGDAEYYAIHQGQDSNCDFGLKASNGSCVNDTRMTLNPVSGWLGWSLHEQRYQISGNIPVNFVPTLGTHNSFSSPEGGVWNGLFVDQTLSMWDQLQAGARYVRLDPAYYVGQMHVCHGSAGGCGAGTDGRLYAYALGEVVDWLNANPNEFIILDIHADTGSTGSHNDLLWEPINAYLGLSRIYTFQNWVDAGAPQTYPSIQQLVKAGKQVMIISSQEITGNGQFVTFDRTASYTETMSKNATWFQCQNDLGGPLWSTPRNFAYASEDRSGSVVVDFLSNYGYINDAEVSVATGCGYGIIAIDQLLNLQNTYPLFSFQSINPAPTASGPDTRREASVWSFDGGDFGSKGPAIAKPNGHWSSDVTTASHYYACASSTPDAIAWPTRRGWAISGAPTTYNQALTSALCPIGYVFSAPVNGSENFDLYASIPYFPDSGLWLNYIGTAASVLNASPSQVNVTLPSGAPDPTPYAVTVQLTGLPNQGVNLYPGLIPVTVSPSTLNLDATGSGSFTVTPTATAASRAPGTYTGSITWLASYGGNGSLPVSLTVQAPTQTVLSAFDPSDHIGTTFAEGTQITLYGKIGSNGLGGPTTGTMTFRSLDLSNSVTVLGQPAVQSDGLDTLNVQLAPGTYQVSAAYSGDATHAASSSGPLAITVLPNITPSPSSITLSYQIGAQNAAPQSLTVTHLNNAAMQLSAGTACFDQPDGTACWLSAGPVPAGSATSFTIPLSYTSAIASLPVGVYHASVTLNDGVDQPSPVLVTLSVIGTLTLTPSTLNFLIPYGATSVAGQSVAGTVGSFGVELVWAGQSDSWLSYQNGTVVVLPSLLRAGGLPQPGATFSGSIVLTTPFAGSPQKVYVNVQIVQPATVDTLPTNQPIAVDGTPFVSPQTFAWAPGTSHTISVSSPIAMGVDQLTFGSWSDNGAQTHSVMAPLNATTWLATLNTQYPVTSQVAPLGGGTITLSPPPVNGYYAAGTQVTVTTAPNQGLQFIGFSGSVSGQTSPVTVTVNGPFNVTANFAAAGGPKMYVIPGAVTLTPTVNYPNLATVALNLENIGPGAAVGATIQSVTGITVVSGSGTVQSLSPAANLGTILPNASTPTTLLVDWPPSATRVRFTVNFSASGYTGATTVTLFR